MSNHRLSLLVAILTPALVCLFGFLFTGIFPVDVMIISMVLGYATMRLWCWIVDT